MSKYSILLALIAFGSAQAWDGKLIQISNPREDGTVHTKGIQVRFYDHNKINTVRKMEAILAEEGFKHPYVGGNEYYQHWVKTVDGVIYCAFVSGSYCPATPPELDCGKFANKAHYHNKACSWIFHDAHDGPTFRRINGDIEVWMVCKDHLNAKMLPWLHEVSEGYKSAVQSIKQHYPKELYGNLTYQEIDYKDQPDAAQSPWDHLTNFVAKEKLALGAFALGLLSIGLASR